MRLVPYNTTDLKDGWYKRSDNQKLLEEFANSDLDCAEVKDFTQKNSLTCSSSLNLSARRYGILNVRAISRKGRVFLIRKPIG